MADLSTTKLIDLALLTTYDTEIKKVINASVDTTSLHTVALDSSVRKIYFYTQKSADVTVGTTTPAFTVDLSDIDTKLGDLTTLTTTAKASLVAAINEIDADLGTATLTTTAQTVKGAINELDAELGSITATDMKTTATTVSGAVAELSDKITTLNGVDTVTGSVAKSIKDAVEALDTAADVELATVAAGVVTIKAVKETDGVIAASTDTTKDVTFAKVATTGKAEDVTIADAKGIVTATTVEGAIEELAEKAGAGDDNYVVSVSEATTPTTGMLKSYEIFQGKNADKTAKKIATIDIPKDFLVKSGSVVKDPAGQPAGTYIALVINSKDASATDETIYINVKDLCDVYTAQASATQVQLAISATNEISATIVASSVTATELATDAVETAKIKDANVTAAKLATDSIVASYAADGKTVQSSTMDATTVALLQKAHDAVQESDVKLATDAEIKALFPTT